jgi:hypothetical protein
MIDIVNRMARKQLCNSMIEMMGDDGGSSTSFRLLLTGKACHTPNCHRRRFDTPSDLLSAATNISRLAYCKACVKGNLVTPSFSGFES